MSLTGSIDPLPSKSPIRLPLLHQGKHDLSDGPRDASPLQDQPGKGMKRAEFLQGILSGAEVLRKACSAPSSAECLMDCCGGGSERGIAVWGQLKLNEQDLDI